MTVSLRPLDAADAAWCDGWLSAFAASMSCREMPTVRDLLAWSRRSPRGRAEAILHDGEPAGVAAWRAPQRGTAVIEVIALPPAGSRRGLGMEAATRIERAAREGGAKRAYAPVPAAHGIAVYFWIRLGYHPLLRPEWPEERAATGWMARDLA